MKPFFGKQIIESPRRGHSDPSIKVKCFGKIEEDGEYYGPTRIPMSMGGKAHAYTRNNEGKDFSDVLGPLEHYLRSSVGRHWNDIYSELCQNLGRSSWAIRHILTAHLNVAVNTYRGVDGLVWDCNKWGVSSVWGYWRSPEFYVEPETGILRESIQRDFTKAVPKEPVRVKLADGRDAERINGLWYIVLYEQRKDQRVWVGFEHYTIKGIDQVQSRFVGWKFIPSDDRITSHVENGVTYVYAGKKSASKKDLKLIREALK